ncbi:MAG: TIGR04372 family glycosyltransferase [Telmatospirillum sp.]|nr:TIGR04372 family glycosyltransferase [Telmatospirillum sp.]
MERRTLYPSYAERMARKREPLRGSLGLWWALLLAIPGIAVFRILAALGYEIARYPNQFGHQCQDVEHHLRSAAGRLGKCVYIRGDAVPNRYLLKKHKELIRVWHFPRPVLTYLERAERASIRAFGKTIFYVRGFEEKIVDTPTWGLPAMIRFNEEEHRKGMALLAGLGLARGSYVCMHARDPAYGLSYFSQLWLSRGIAAEAATLRADETERNLGQRSRNSDFRDYAAALLVLEKRGLKGVRVGAKVATDYTEVLPNLVDFAGRERARLGPDGEFADLYLMAHCAFFVGTTTGVTGCAFTFSRPIALVNHFPWMLAFIPPIENSLHIPRLVRKKSGDILSFAKLIDIGTNWRLTYDDTYLDRESLEVLDNTPEELADAVTEMCDRVAGAFVPCDGDADLQARFALLAGPAMPQDPLNAKVGCAFLRRHAELLADRHSVAADADTH